MEGGGGGPPTTGEVVLFYSLVDFVVWRSALKAWQFRRYHPQISKLLQIQKNSTAVRVGRL